MNTPEKWKDIHSSLLPDQVMGDVIGTDAEITFGKCCDIIVNPYIPFESLDLLTLDAIYFVAFKKRPIHLSLSATLSDLYEKRIKFISF